MEINDRYTYKGITFYHENMAYGPNYTISDDMNKDEFTSIIDMIIDPEFDIVSHLMNNTFHYFNRYICSLAVNHNCRYINDQIELSGVEFSCDLLREVITTSTTLITSTSDEWESNYYFKFTSQSGKLKVIAKSNLGNDIEFCFMSNGKTIDYNYCSYHYDNNDNETECKSGLCDELLRNYLSGKKYNLIGEYFIF